MKTTTFYLMATFCAGFLCNATPVPTPLPSCKCCQWRQRIIKPTDFPIVMPTEPDSPEFNPDFFKECTLHPMKVNDRYMGWKANEALAAFCIWFKPLEKGIKLDYKGKTLQFIINYPESVRIHGFCVYVLTLPSDRAKAVAKELKKKDRGSPVEKIPTCQIGRVVGNHLIVIYGKSKYEKVMRGILGNITDFMDFS